MTSRRDDADSLARELGVPTPEKKTRRATENTPTEGLAPPVTERNALGNVAMEWPEQQITVVASHIIPVRGGIEARLTMSRNGTRLRAPFRLNVHSISACEGLVKKLRTKRKDVDWEGLVDHICQEVNDFDPQKPSIDLTAHERETETSWLLEPLVRARKPMLLYSEGGQGKSTTALAILVELATLAHVLPGVTLPGRAVKSLFLDWESDEDDTQEVMELLSSGANTVVPLDHIIYRRMSGSLPEHFETLQKDVAEHQIEVVVTDSIIAAGGEEGDRPATAARAYFDVMRALNVASIGITHLSKENDKSKGGKPYGSVYYWNLARDIWRLRQDQVEGEATADIALFHEKSNRGGKRKPLGWQVTFGEEAITFDKADVSSMPEVGKQTSTSDQLSTLLSKAMHIQDIYAELPHIKQGTIRQALFRKTTVPRFQNLGNERWGRATPLRVTEEDSYVTEVPFFKGIN